MIKRLHIAAVLFSLTSSCWASGFYVGAGLGPDLANFRVTSHVNQVHNGILTFNVKNYEQLSGTGVFGTIFAGYGKKLPGLEWCRCKLNGFYLAGELNANVSTLRHRNFNSEYVHQVFSTTTYRMRYGFGASIIPGYLYTDTTLFYGRLGYANGNFKVTTSDISLKDINKNLSGFRWGLGIKQSVTPQLAVRVEYSHIGYNSKTIRTVTAVNKKTQFTPYTNQVEFGLVYDFCPVTT